MIAVWPDKFWMKFPSGNFHCFMLSGEAVAIVYLEQKDITHYWQYTYNPWHDTNMQWTAAISCNLHADNG